MPESWQTTVTAPPARPEPEWKHYLGEACPHGLHVALVDGTHVRNTYDSDFSQGGNGFRYSFVPRDEIWVDSCLPETEWSFVAFHECRESELMRRGWPYGRAHDRAKLLEDKFRRGGQK